VRDALVLLACLYMCAQSGWFLYQALVRGIIYVGRPMRRVKKETHPSYYRNQVAGFSVMFVASVAGVVWALASALTSN
jgi:hypothetical protein